MKRVRFESPLKVRDTNIMSYDTECHSPRPFIDIQIKPFLSSPRHGPSGSPRVVSYTNDPVQKFEFANCSPYPTVSKTCTTNFTPVSECGFPSSDLDLSFLDSNGQEPRSVPQKLFKSNKDNYSPISFVPEPILKIVAPSPSPSNTLSKNDDFFLKNPNNVNLNQQQPLYEQINKLTLDKENNPLVKKMEMIKLSELQNGNINNVETNNNKPYLKSCCSCYNCSKKISTPCRFQENEDLKQYCLLSQRFCSNTNCPQHLPHVTSCNCHRERAQLHVNAIDKTWQLEKYEPSKKSHVLNIDSQNSVKEKREPTVSDLFKIIKLQNEQLQLLQEKVDRFIASSSKNDNLNLIQNCLTEPRINTNDEHHKISIGVMTSFEMVRTSTVINKDFIKKTEAQIQCNRSQISIKEVSKAQPVNINFLDGIKKCDAHTSINDSLYVNGDVTKNTGFEDKILNELSLYNVQVNNDTTPQMSPEQSLYLDVKDYSDTDTDSDDPANVGWTYYNKVMTRVNGLLQDSDMPSSASALYRNTRQKCLMQIDKTNVSIAKRVTFGENPVNIQPQQPSTDTSLKMKQLAAKYLNSGLHATSKPIASTDLSFGTKNYMEKHKLIQGYNNIQARPQDIPKFLDVTALKQQPKLL